MMSAYKAETATGTIEDLVSAFYGDIEELAGEMREVVDSAEGGLAETQRIQTMGETADLLEGISCRPELPHLPEELAKMQVRWTRMVNTKRGRGPSRAIRCENACSGAQAAIEAVRGWCDEQEIEAAETERVLPEETRGLVDELRDWCDEVQGQWEEAEGAEFPGMRG